MVIQRWSARIHPRQLREEFLPALQEMNHLYEVHGRRSYTRVYHELYGGHMVVMEREFSSVAVLDADENLPRHSPELQAILRPVKERLIAAVVPGTIRVELFETISL